MDGHAPSLFLTAVIVAVSLGVVLAALYWRRRVRASISFDADCSVGSVPRVIRFEIRKRGNPPIRIVGLGLGRISDGMWWLQRPERLPIDVTLESPGQIWTFDVPLSGYVAHELRGAPFQFAYVETDQRVFRRAIGSVLRAELERLKAEATAGASGPSIPFSRD